MKTICPECQTGKHGNCDGVGDIKDDGNPIACQCENGEHPHRTTFLIEGPSMVMDMAPTGPENDPGIRIDSFPELIDGEDWMAKYRMAPNSEVICTLSDVEVMNSQGIWVPVVPLPLYQAFGIVQCLCGKHRLGKKRYQEHYAYAHILGMEN